MFRKKMLSIPEFYEKKSVFITGATGFIGKILLEKLLRSCPGVKNIYILIRSKKNKNAEERLKTLFEGPLFDTLRKDTESVLQKVIPIVGNISDINLGISDEDRKVLVNNVSIVYHIAASVRFNDFLTTAIIRNVRATREVVRLVEDLKTVDSFVHVSTAYSHCENSVVEEAGYPTQFNWKDAIDIAENVKDNSAEILSEKIMNGSSPNTYILTKRLAEQLVEELCRDRFPTIIVRPSIVICTHSEPVEYFVDNINGAIAMFVAAGKGINRFVLFTPGNNQDNIFADNLAKAMIIGSWQKALEPDLGNIKYYNVTSDILWSPKYAADHFHLIMENPLETYFGIPSLQAVTCWYQYYIYFIIYQLIPALLADIVLKVSGSKVRLLFFTRKMFIVCKALETFTRNKWTFKNENYENLENILLEKDVEQFKFLQNRVDDSDKSAKLSKFLQVLAETRPSLMGEVAYAGEKEKRFFKRLQMLNTAFKTVLKIFAGYIVFWKYNTHYLIYNWLCNYMENVDQF